MYSLLMIPHRLLRSDQKYRSLVITIEMLRFESLLITQYYLGKVTVMVQRVSV